MCRILGITNYDYKKHRTLVERFAALADTGKTLKGDTPGHRDGWGIGYYKNGKPVVYRSGSSILDEKDVLLKHAAAASGILIVHLRKSAWPETTIRAHAHPFKHKNIIFAHNGTVRDYKKLPGKIRIKKDLSGSLDSEVYFYYAMNDLSLGMETSFCKAAASLKKNNVYSSLSCVFSDGNALYAYREFTSFPKYYTLYSATEGNSHIICSEQIAKKLTWKLMKNGELVILP